MKKDLTPKQWMKKYCHKDYVICDGMTDAMNPMDTLNMILVLGGFFGIAYFSWDYLKRKINL